MEPSSLTVRIPSVMSLHSTINPEPPEALVEGGTSSGPQGPEDVPPSTRASGGSGLIVEWRLRTEGIRTVKLPGRMPIR